MEERILNPSEYTPEIQAAIERIKYRMNYTMTKFNENDIIVVGYGDSVYVLANPVLGTEPIYDEIGRVVEYVPLHNITIMQPIDSLSTHFDLEGKTVFEYKIPRFRILRPDLCMKLGA